MSGPESLISQLVVSSSYGLSHIPLEREIVLTSQGFAPLSFALSPSRHRVPTPMRRLLVVIIRTIVGASMYDICDPVLGIGSLNAAARFDA